MAVMPQWLGTFNQPVPEQPLKPITNYGQAIGDALTQGGNLVEHQQDILQKMIQARMKAEESKQQAWLLQKDEERKAAAEQRKADEEKRMLDYLAKVNKGKEISPTLAKDPSLSGPSQPSGLPTAQDFAQLELDGPQGRAMPPQSVGGLDSTRLMGEALNRPENRGEMAGGRTPYSRDEIPYLAHQFGQMNPSDLMTATKPPEEKQNRIRLHTIGDRVVLVNMDTREVEDMGPAPKPAPRPEPDRSASVFSQEQQLRTQYLGQTKDFRDVRDAYGRIETSIKDPSPAGDLSLIYNFMKMQDPGSTVRETEFAAAAASGSYGDRLQAAGAKILAGERLSTDQRADFIGQAKKLYEAAQSQKKKTQGEYKALAGKYPGLDASRVMMDDDIADNAQKGQGPQPGAIEDGYRFKGGDPANPNSWEQVR